MLPSNLRRRTPARTALAFLAAAFVAASDAGAQAVYPAAPDNYRHLLTLLQPGDTLALSAGEYRDGLPVHKLSGEPGRPITISGPPSGPSATFVARSGHSTVSLVDSHYLVIRNLVLEGHNLPVDAVKAEKPSLSVHDITLENLVIRGHGNSQQTVGISTKCPAWNWVIRGNTIVGAGTGIYLGDSDGSAAFFAGLIERNLIVDTIGYNLQVKHQLPRPGIPGMPVGRSMTIIRHNVFAKAGPVSTDAPRPNVLVGHFPLDGAGAEDDYAIYGNFFYHNPREAFTFTGRRVRPPDWSGEGDSHVRGERDRPHDPDCADPVCRPQRGGRGPPGRADQRGHTRAADSVGRPLPDRSGGPRRRHDQHQQRGPAWRGGRSPRLCPRRPDR